YGVACPSAVFPSATPLWVPRCGTRYPQRIVIRHACGPQKIGLTFRSPGIRRLPVRRFPSKLCATLVCRGGCAWTEHYFQLRWVTLVPPALRHGGFGDSCR